MSFPKFDTVKLYSKTCVKRPLSKIPKFGFQDQSSPNAGQKYCRMLQCEHSSILSIFIKLPFVITIFVLFIFDRPFYTGHPASSEQLENFRKEIFNKQVVDIKMNTMQNRMNDMEGLVHHTNMESSMKKK